MSMLRSAEYVAEMRNTRSARRILVPVRKSVGNFKKDEMEDCTMSDDGTRSACY